MASIHLAERSGTAEFETQCEICGSEMARAEIVFCARCATPAHRDCFEYAGSCAVYGCGSTESLAAEQRRRRSRADVPLYVGFDASGGQADEDERPPRLAAVAAPRAAAGAASAHTREREDTALAGNRPAAIRASVAVPAFALLALGLQAIHVTSPDEMLVCGLLLLTLVAVATLIHLFASCSTTGRETGEAPEALSLEPLHLSRAARSGRGPAAGRRARRSRRRGARRDGDHARSRAPRAADPFHGVLDATVIVGKRVMFFCFGAIGLCALFLDGVGRMTPGEFMGCVLLCPAMMAIALFSSNSMLRPTR